MNKQEFISVLRDRLTGVPQQELDERLSFLEEAIADRIEEGLSEEEAVGAMGGIDTIVEQIIADVPLSKLVKEKAKSRRKLRAWEIVLLSVGSPIWGSLALAAAVIVIALYASLWAVVGALWCAPVSLVACGIAGVAEIVICSIMGYPFVGLALLGMGIFAAGLAIFATIGCLAAVRGAVSLTKLMVRGIKRMFIGRRDRA